MQEALVAARRRPARDPDARGGGDAGRPARRDVRPGGGRRARHGASSSWTSSRWSTSTACGARPEPGVTRPCTTASTLPSSGAEGSHRHLRRGLVGEPSRALHPGALENAIDQASRRGAEPLRPHACRESGDLPSVRSGLRSRQRHPRALEGLDRGCAPRPERPLRPRPRSHRAQPQERRRGSAARRLVVFTGVSGSGKSSLAFGTIYAEAQRRYFESVAPYARRLGPSDGRAAAWTRSPGCRLRSRCSSSAGRQARARP